MIPTKEQAWDLLCEYNEGEFHRLHARIVGDVMRYFAVQLGYADEADFWQAVGILHDLDFEQWPEQHCTKPMRKLPCRPRKSLLPISSKICYNKRNTAQTLWGVA